MNKDAISVVDVQLGGIWMIQEINLEICSLIILITILIMHSARRNIPIKRTNIFITLVIFETIAIIAKLLVRIMNIYFDIEGTKCFDYIMVMHSAFEYAVPILLMYYMIAWTRKSLFHNRIALFLSFIPCLFYVFMLIYNILYNIFDQNLNQYVFMKRMETNYSNIYVVYCIMFGILYATMNKSKINYRKLTSIIILEISILLFYVWQEVTFGTDFLDFILAFTIFLAYIIMQNPYEMYDEKTEAMNREIFEEVIEIDMMTNQEFDIIILALDDFKFINKTFGLVNGDILLRQVVSYLKTVTKRSYVYRYGADQFALKMQRNDGSIEDVLQEIKMRFLHPWITGEVTAMLSVTICCVSCPEDAGDLQSVIDVIDFSMLSAKKTEKGSVVFAKNMNLKDFHKEKAIEQAIELAMNRGSVEVYYQPIYSTKTNCYSAAEALVRIFDEDLGYISPEIFIPLTEKNGMIVRLGKIIFEKVCKFISENDIANTSIEYIEVNVSVVQCMQNHFANDLLEIMDRYHVNPNQINLEVTETAAVSSVAVLKENMEILSERGISFSLDDYGTGYSTLGYLHSLPFQIIKLDKDMVWDAFKTRRAGITLRYTVGMLKELEVDIVAEGVETDEQQLHLSRIGCDYLQGWYYSKAVPEREFLQLIHGEN